MLLSTMRNQPARTVFLVLLLSVALASAFSDEEREQPPDFQMIIGPRVGVSYVATDPESFTETVELIYWNEGRGYVPVTSLFGIIAEQRILLGETASHFAFQEVVLVSGLEQSIALPSASLLIGYRDASGFEIGFGPNVTLSGIGVVVAIGYTIDYRGVYVPIDLSCVIPSRERPAQFAFTTGFNFITRATYRDN
jgi:hypothetical protein